MPIKCNFKCLPQGCVNWFYQLSILCVHVGQSSYPLLFGNYSEKIGKFMLYKEIIS